MPGDRPLGVVVVVVTALVVVVGVGVVGVVAGTDVTVVDVGAGVTVVVGRRVVVVVPERVNVRDPPGGRFLSAWLSALFVAVAEVGDGVLA